MKILIVAGGTGGHIFPAIRLAEEISSMKSDEVIFITSSRPKHMDLLNRKNIRSYSLPIIAMQSGSIFSILNFAIRLLIGIVKSLILLLRLRPGIVIGFGGYVTGPILLLASLSGAKTIIHEQNVYPGRANRILARFVDRIAVNFSESTGYLKGFESKVFISGNPLRREILSRIPYPVSNIPEKTFTLLAMGGSQGSQTLNRIIPKALDLIGDDKKKMLEIVHISGDRDRDEVMRSYRDKNIKNRVLSFTDEIHKFYNESDFVISRSGATTISELLFLAKPSILIPYPYAQNHQRFNAEVLSKKGAAVLIEEAQLTAEALKDAIVKFMDKEFLSEMSARVKKKDEDQDPCLTLMKEVFA